MLSRLEPSRTLPPYTYIPGRTPHPKSSPAGHAFGVVESKPAAFDKDHLEASPDFRYAIDLFHAGYYWEAHEVWEGLWHALGRTGPAANAAKGLIKLAAAGVKVREGNATGAAAHLRRAAELLTQAVDAGMTRIGRLDVALLATQVRNLAAGVTAANDPGDASPHPVWPLTIQVE